MSSRRHPPNDDPNPSYEVGYGKPPIATRWTKGQSGNPRGPEKRPRSIGAAADKALSSKVAVVDAQGRRRLMRAEDLIMRKFRDAAIGGDGKAAAFLMDRAERFRSGQMNDTAEAPGLTPNDIELLEAVLERTTRRSSKGEDGA